MPAPSLPQVLLLLAQRLLERLQLLPLLSVPLGPIRQVVDTSVNDAGSQLFHRLSLTRRQQLLHLRQLLFRERMCECHTISFGTKRLLGNTRPSNSKLAVTIVETGPRPPQKGPGIPRGLARGTKYHPEVVPDVDQNNHDRCFQVVNWCIINWTMGAIDTHDLQQALQGLRVPELAPLHRGGDRGTQGTGNRRDGKEGAQTEAVLAVRDEQIMVYLLAGYAVRKIAKMTGFAYQVVLQTVNRTDFLDRVKREAPIAYERVREELKGKLVTHQQRIDELSAQALDKLEDLLQSDRELIAFKACETILDRNPETPKKHSVDNRHAVAFFNPADLLNAAATAQELHEKEPLGISGQPGTIIDNAVSDRG